MNTIDTYVLPLGLDLNLIIDQVISNCQAQDPVIRLEYEGVPVSLTFERDITDEDFKYVIDKCKKFGTHTRQTKELLV